MNDWSNRHDRPAGWQPPPPPPVPSTPTPASANTVHHDYPTMTETESFFRGVNALSDLVWKIATIAFAAFLVFAAFIAIAAGVDSINRKMHPILYFGVTKACTAVYPADTCAEIGSAGGSAVGNYERGSAQYTNLLVSQCVRYTEATSRPLSPTECADVDRFLGMV